MFCREWTLVKTNEPERLCRPLTCKSWGCDYCQPTRRAQLIAKAMSGAPERFITLTVNPRVGNGPSDRLRILAHAWNVIMKRERREHPKSELAYFAVVEATRRGEPHLHILYRGPSIPQHRLSDAMASLAGSPIVDIRKIRNPVEAVRYVAKYIGKRPAQFGTSKRYWCSRNYEAPYQPPEDAHCVTCGKWSIDRRPIDEVVLDWIGHGYAMRQYDDRTLYAVLMGATGTSPPRAETRRLE